MIFCASYRCLLFLHNVISLWMAPLEDVFIFLYFASMASITFFHHMRLHTRVELTGEAKNIVRFKGEFQLIGASYKG